MYEAVASTLMSVLKEGRSLRIKPIEGGITYTQVTARQVIGWWSKRKGTPDVLIDS